MPISEQDAELLRAAQRKAAERRTSDAAIPVLHALARSLQADGDKGLALVIEQAARAKVVNNVNERADSTKKP